MSAVRVGRVAVLLTVFLGGFLVNSGVEANPKPLVIIKVRPTVACDVGNKAHETSKPCVFVEDSRGAGLCWDQRDVGGMPYCGKKVQWMVAGNMNNREVRLEWISSGSTASSDTCLNLAGFPITAAGGAGATGTVDPSCTASGGGTNSVNWAYKVTLWEMDEEGDFQQIGEDDPRVIIDR